MNKSKPILIEDAENTVNFLQGKILTIIEALNLSPRQEKAVKDLIKASISDCHMAFLGIAYPETKTMIEPESWIPNEEQEIHKMPVIDLDTKAPTITVPLKKV